MARKICSAVFVLLPVVASIVSIIVGVPTILEWLPQWASNSTVVACAIFIGLGLVAQLLIWLPWKRKRATDTLDLEYVIENALIGHVEHLHRLVRNQPADGPTDMRHAVIIHEVEVVIPNSLHVLLGKPERDRYCKIIDEAKTHAGDDKKKVEMIISAAANHLHTLNCKRLKKNVDDHQTKLRELH